MSEPELTTETGNGARRQSWARDNPRDMLVEMIKGHPESEEGEIMELCWGAVMENSGYIRTIFEYWFQNNYRSATVNSGWTATRLAADRDKRTGMIAALKDRARPKLEAAIKSKLLDMVMPNGKALADCTGTDCEFFGPQVGGWLMRVGFAVGRRRVGDVLSEEQTRDLYVGN